jgi:hypothetical protein
LVPFASLCSGGLFLLSRFSKIHQDFITKASAGEEIKDYLKKLSQS